MRQLFAALLGSMLVSACSCEPPPVADAGPDAGPDCPPGTLTCPCDDGACEDGNVCDTVEQTCRAPTACEAAGCAPNQLCEQRDGEDAVCLPECDPGFTFENDACTPTPSCTDGDPGFVDCGDRECTLEGGAVVCGDCIAPLVEVGDSCVSPDDCQAICGEGRDCEISDGGPAVCGDCLPGFIEDGDACVQRVTCDNLNCPAGEVCIEGSANADAECREEANCPSNQVDPGNNTCVDCVFCFDDANPLPGVTGIGNAGFAFEGICVCTLEDGFFQSIDGAVKECDADGDGWVNADLLPVNRLSGGANPFAREARCDVRTVDRFELRSDEDRAEVTLAAAKTITIEEIATRYQLAGTSAVIVENDVSFVELYEPEVLDDPVRFELRYDEIDPALRLRTYGGFTDDGSGAHQFTAREANPLTKACNQNQDDLNYDSVPDVSQAHDVLPADGLDARPVDAYPVFYRMAYWLELNRGFYVDGTPHGTYVIEEKARALAATEPLGLEFDVPPEEGDYWQICARGRGGDYPGADQDELSINFDFAGWHEGCERETGGCTVDGRVGYDGRPLNTPAADLTVGPDLVDGNPRFAGMNHSSMFACLSFGDDLPANETTHRRAPEDGTFLMQDCRLDPRVVQGPLAGEDANNPSDPQMSCGALVLPGAPNYNYWGFRRQQDYTTLGDYQRGCIDEGVEWNELLCLVGSEDTTPDAFGELFCGCGVDRQGDQCERGCPAEQRFANRQAQGGALVGLWMCASNEISEEVTLSDGTFSLTGEVPAFASPISPLCESSDCATGFSLSAGGTQ